MQQNVLKCETLNAIISIVSTFHKTGYGCPSLCTLHFLHEDFCPGFGLAGGRRTILARGDGDAPQAGFFLLFRLWVVGLGHQVLRQPSGRNEASQGSRRWNLYHYGKPPRTECYAINGSRSGGPQVRLILVRLHLKLEGVPVYVWMQSLGYWWLTMFVSKLLGRLNTWLFVTTTTTSTTTNSRCYIVNRRLSSPF